MSQTGFTPILLYASGTTGVTPSPSNLTTSANGCELAINYADGILFYKDGAGTVREIQGGGGGGGGSKFTTTDFTATAGQTTFSVAYVVDNIAVYRNGVKLGLADFTATTGTTVVLTIGANAGDLIQTQVFSSSNGSTLTTTDITASPGQTVFSVTYEIGFIEVYLNGIKLGQADYTATNGTTVVLNTPANLNDLFEAVVLSYSSVISVANGGTGLSSVGAAGNLLTSNGTAWTSSPPAPGVLTGSLLMWAAASAPSGYLLCDGTAVSRATYAALFAVIATTFGAGDGSTTFNLPNYVNRMPYGAAIGSTGGSATTSIGVANLPSHNHTLSTNASLTGTIGSGNANIQDPGHAHSYVQGLPSIAGGGGGGRIGDYTTGSTGGAVTGIYDAGHTHSISGGSVQLSGVTDSTGSNVPVTTISPYLGINFIIKT